MMNKENTVSAIQIADIDKYYNIWKENHTGSRSEFLSFMLTISPQREHFISQMNTETHFYGSVLTVTLA